MALFWKNVEIFGKTADMSGLGKYSMGGYGRIYRVIHCICNIVYMLLMQN